MQLFLTPLSYCNVGPQAKRSERFTFSDRLVILIISRSLCLRSVLRPIMEIHCFLSLSRVVRLFHDLKIAIVFMGPKISTSRHPAAFWIMKEYFHRVPTYVPIRSLRMLPPSYHSFIFQLPLLPYRLIGLLTPCLKHHPIFQKTSITFLIRHAVHQHPAGQRLYLQ